MPESAELNPNPRSRELMLVLGAWFVLALVTVLFAKQNLSAPGLYYDEAIFAGMAKDFLIGHVHGQHLPDHETMTLFGRPFPFFVQTYLGALKCWMLIPAFQVFGSTFAVLRATNLFCQVIALLLLMLGACRWLGVGTAIIAGALLAFDPSYFFVSTLDWGVAGPSFVCRCACLYFAIRWRDLPKLHDAFFVGLFAGLGFFNKADFAIFLIAITVATLVCYWRQFFGAIRQHLGSMALACAGFAIGGGAMIVKIPRLVVLTVVGPHVESAGPFGEKFKTLVSMYDGTHFYRLMNVGGIFERMYDGATGPRTLFGIALLAALLVFAFVFAKNREQARRILFLVVAAVLITLGVFVLADAVRIHHAILVYPLPHLILAALIATFWKMRAAQRKLDYAISAIIALVVIDLIAGELHAIVQTEQLIQQTGGRGRWSESLNEFCGEFRNRSDLTIVSLDWGFNEQLIFLTDEPKLSEPIWQLGATGLSLPTDANYIYLAHPPEYSLVKADFAYLSELQKNGANAEITPHFDREHEIAFYTIRFR